MKLFNFIIRCASICLLLGASGATTRLYGAPADKITLSEEDIATLEAMGFSRAEAQETAQLINNMSAEEQNALAQIGQQVAQDMSKSGLDPNDPEAMVNFLSKQESRPMPPSEQMPTMPKREFAPMPVELPSGEEKKISAPVKNPLATGDIGLIINEILKHLASLRQKRQTSDRLTKFSPELDALAFNLDVINRPELFSYITSQEFSHLYAILEHLHRTLLTYEPRITAFPFFEEDEIENPYETLQLPIHARMKDIEAAYRKLKQKHDPDMLSKTDKIKQLSKKERERILTEARLAFIEIKAAYESLKNPKEKAAIDKALTEYHALEEKNEQLSDSAFDTLISIIENLLFKQQLLKDISSLLKKYSPEEKKKLDEWEKQRQLALEISKKEYESAVTRGKTQKTISVTPREDIGEKFWREFRAAETPSRGGYPGLTTEPFQEPKLPRGFEPEAPKESKKPDTSAAAAKPKEGEKEKDKEKDKEKKDGDDKITRGSKLGSEKKEEEVSDFDKSEFSGLLHVKELKALKKELDEPESKPGSLAYSLRVNLPSYLRQPLPARPQGYVTPAAEINPGLKRIDEFMRKANLKKIVADYAELLGLIKDTKKSNLKAEYKKMWQDLQSKFGDTIDKLEELVNTRLSPRLAPSRSGYAIDQSVQEFELLNRAHDEAQDKKLQELIKSDAEFMPGQTGFLGNFSYLANLLKVALKHISKELGTDNKPGKK